MYFFTVIRRFFRGHSFLHQTNNTFVVSRDDSTDSCMLWFASETNFLSRNSASYIIPSGMHGKMNFTKKLFWRWKCSFRLFKSYLKQNKDFLVIRIIVLVKFILSYICPSVELGRTLDFRKSRKNSCNVHKPTQIFLLISNISFASSQTKSLPYKNVEY